MAIITPELKKFDKKLAHLSAKYKSTTTPVNIFDIRRRILNADKDGKASAEEISEQVGILGFSYKYRQKNFDETIKKLEQLKIPGGALKKLYKHKIKENKKKLNMLASIGKPDFSEKSYQLYGFPDQELIDKAKKILELESVIDNGELNPQSAKKMLKKYLDSLHLDWKITTKKMLSYASITPSKKTVTLCSKRKFSEKTIKRLAVHEIGTHGVRYLNARLQPLSIFKNFPGYLSTEEGLAAFNEELNGYLSDETLRRYAGRVLAVDYAKDHDLIETYVFLKKYFDKNSAFNIAFRVKRGLPNSESKGCFTKDYLYLKGFFRIKNYIKDNPLKYLYYGKVNIDYVKLIKKLEPELSKIKFYPPMVSNFEEKEKLAKY
ncbi:MAG: tyrosine/phenylalanine carboxypeptidase domain-containing protein [Nanobdellota archaeon]